jgi:hypothetical protein
MRRADSPRHLVAPPTALHRPDGSPTRAEVGAGQGSYESCVIRPELQRPPRVFGRLLFTHHGNCPSSQASIPTGPLQPAVSQGRIEVAKRGASSGLATGPICLSRRLRRCYPPRRGPSDCRSSRQTWVPFALLIVVVAAVFLGSFDEWPGHLHLAIPRIGSLPIRR